MWRPGGTVSIKQQRSAETKKVEAFSCEAEVEGSGSNAQTIDEMQGQCVDPSLDSPTLDAVEADRQRHLEMEPAAAPTPKLEARSRRLEELVEGIDASGVGAEVAQGACGSNGFAWSDELGCHDPILREDGPSDQEIEGCLEQKGVPQLDDSGTFWCRDEEWKPKDDLPPPGRGPGLNCKQDPTTPTCKSLNDIGERTAWVEPAAKLMLAVAGAAGGPLGNAISWGSAAHDLVEEGDPTSALLNTMSFGLGKTLGAAAENFNPVTQAAQTTAAGSMSLDLAHNLTSFVHGENKAQ
jgi:hypothetical protein